MVIPVGLLSDTERTQQRTRGRDDQGYWVGNRFVFTPQKNAPWPSLPEVQKAALAASQAAQQVQQAAQTFPGLLEMGDGPQGEGFGGGRESVAPGQAPGMSEAGHVNAPDPNANVQGMLGQPASTNPAGLPGLPSFNEQATAPTAPTAPTNQDLAVSEVDPQGPSGATGKGKGKSANAAPNATEQAAAVATAQALADDQANANVGKATTSFMDAVKSFMDQTGIGIGMGVGAGMSQSDIDAANAAPAGVPGSAANAPDGGPAGGGLGGADGVGGPGAGGMGSPGGMGGGGSGAPGGSSDQGPGSWRHGGPVRGDRDGRLEPVRGILHEGDYAQSPEATSYYGPKFMKALNERRIPKKAALGLLADAHDKPQSKKIDRGLLGI